MARRSLRPQLNQIRAWVRQGRTDAWIAHQLEVSATELHEFRRQHGLSADDEDSSQELDLRDEIEAEIEAVADQEDEDEDEADSEAEDADSSDGAGEEADGAEAEGRPRRRRRRGRRGGRGGRKGPLEASFDHGESDGYGLWLDPAVRDDPTYSEHWAGHREVSVSIEPDRIIIRRAGGDAAADDSDDE